MTKAPIATTTDATTATNQNRKAMRFSAEWWAFWGGVWAVALTVAAALAGLVAWLASVYASEAAEARTKGLELAISQQKERAASAERDAADAKSLAAKAGEGTAKALADAAEAHRVAEGFRLDIANANERAAQANAIAERERLARLQLEARLADRVITASQQTRLIDTFGAIKGQTVDLLIFGDTPDIAGVTESIAGSLERSGVLVNVFKPFGATGVRGVIVGIGPEASEPMKRAGESLVRILQETLNGGVGFAEFKKLAPDRMSGTGGGSEGALPRGQSQLRIWVGAK